MNPGNEQMLAPRRARSGKGARLPASRAEHTATPTPAQWCVGIVQAADEAGLHITSGAVSAHARRAASCLLEPAPGDSVACLRVAPDEVWVLAVLARDDGVPNVLRCTGPTTLEVQDGPLQLRAGQLRMDSESLHITNQQTQVATASAEVVGRQLRVIGTAIKVVGSLLSTVMDRVNHFSKHHLRTTDGVDRVRATHIEREASELMRLDAQHTLISGEQLVKARGSQIHFG